MPRIDRAERVLDASSEEVWRLLSDPIAWTKWLAPEDMTAQIMRFDFRIGGRYEMALRYPEKDRGAGKSSDVEDRMTGTFVDIEPGRRIVQSVDFHSDDPAFEKPMQMTWVIEPAENGTRLAIIADDVPEPISADDHAVGMNSSLDQLSKLLSASN